MSRPKKMDKRLGMHSWPCCSVCGYGMDSNREYCGETCKKRAYRARIEEKSDHSKYNDINLGDRYGNLKISKLPFITDKGLWRVGMECECGNNIDLLAYFVLIRGTLTSCGCLVNGGKSKRLRKIWNGMIDRCFNIKNKCYYRYGGRGILVCDEWRYKFEDFNKWAYNNDYKDTLTIERKDNNQGYYPENCRWATRHEQNRNMATNHTLKWGDETKILADWARDPRNTIGYHSFRERDAKLHTFPLDDI